MTIVKDSLFTNCFGDEGAAISIKNGGLLLVRNSTFQMDEAYLAGYQLFNATALTEQVVHSGDDEPALTTIFEQIDLLESSELTFETLLPKTARLLANFSSFAFPVNQFVSRSLLDSIESINNRDG